MSSILEFSFPPLPPPSSCRQTKPNSGVSKYDAKMSRITEDNVDHCGFGGNNVDGRRKKKKRKISHFSDLLLMDDDDCTMGVKIPKLILFFSII